MKWEILNKNTKDIIKSLLENRNLKTKKEIDEFINPKDPIDIKFKDLGISSVTIKKVLKRLEKAKKNKEKIIIFGDYDADGVCATAILWETMYKLGFDVLPFVPDRFVDGYGFKTSSFENNKLQITNYKLVICVDNGIVAHEAIKKAKELGIDVIVVDHHTKGSKKLATDYILHSTAVCGSALAWFLALEVSDKVGPSKSASKRSDLNSSLDLVALGTIADQMPLLEINRSLVKFGLPELLKTKRLGLQSMLKDLKLDNVGAYEVGFMIAPRINAMGRLKSATDALRFLCTRDPKKAEDLNRLLNETNIERQKIVDEVVTRVLEETSDEDRVIVVSGSYHEGVIGLASGKITEKYYKPSIVLSIGKKISKASARSINGFNIIEAIKETELIIEGGGHPMAAGFSIETNRISDFRSKINELAQNTLTDEILDRKLKIDLVINFAEIDTELVEVLKTFEPTGQGNYSPVFMSKNVKVKEVKPVGQEGKHLKLKLEQNGIIIDAIYFGGSANDQKLKANDVVNCAYAIEENTWNSKTSIQLKIKDIKI